MRPDQGLTAVIDTNVWISAALSPAGAPAQVLRTVLLHGAVVFSDATFAELELRIWKPKFDRYISLESRRSLLRDARAASLWAEIPPELQNQQWSRDPSDDAFVRTALAAQAPWLITGDEDLLTVQAIANLRILSPAQAMALNEFSKAN
jgi:putative PIN family toxin of toxin-antitoxin system